MQTYSEYNTQNPLPYWSSASMLIQIEAYSNQQQWWPEEEIRHSRGYRSSGIKQNKCKERYKFQFRNGPITARQLCQAFHIQKQSVNMKMREYRDKGFVKFNANTNKWEWIEDVES